MIEEIDRCRARAESAETLLHEALELLSGEQEDGVIMEFGHRVKEHFAAVAVRRS